MFGHVSERTNKASSESISFLIWVQHLTDVQTWSPSSRTTDVMWPTSEFTRATTLSHCTRPHSSWHLGYMLSTLNSHANTTFTDREAIGDHGQTRLDSQTNIAISFDWSQIELSDTWPINWAVFLGPPKTNPAWKPIFCAGRRGKKGEDRGKWEDMAFLSTKYSAAAVEWTRPKGV